VPATLSPIMLKAIPLLAQGFTGVETAKACKKTPQTISEWLRIPEFKAELDSMKMEALESARDKLQSASGIAVQTLVDLAHNSSNPETRRKAALNILEMAGFTRETIEMFAWGVNA
jgi:hypothetical protein